MEFLHVGLLTWFLPIVGIPLILHLLTLHRLKTVELSTFRFLFDSYVQQRRKMKFLDALIALLRTLFLLFLLLAIARPTVRHWAGLFGSGSGRDVVFMIDCSASMESVTDGISAIDRAKQVAGTILAQMSGDERVTVVKVASRPQILSSRFTANSDSLKEQIAGLKTSPARGNLFAAFQELFSPAAEKLNNPQIYLFTDQQATGWKEIREQPLNNLLPEQTKLMLVNVASHDHTAVNLAVVGHAPSPHRAIVGLPVVLRPRVANYSQSSAAEVTVSVLIDEEEIARKKLNVPAGESVVADILFTPRRDGILKGKYQIEGDHFPVDDSFLFTLMIEPKVNVLLVNGVPSADPLLNEGLYLTTAMTTVHPLVPEPQQTAGEEGEPSAAATSSAAPVANEAFAAERQLARIMEVRDVPEAQLTLESLRDVHAVILANCGALNDQQFTWLRDFVSAGGGLLIMPGDKVNPDIYNQRFFPIPNAPDQYLVGATLLPAEGDPAQAGTFAQFASLDMSHPILSVFDVPESRYLTKVNFFKRFPIKLVEKPGATWPLAELSTGTAAIVESRFGDGRVILTGFPATVQWSNLPLKPEFVPLLLRSIGHIRQRSGLEGPSIVTADGVAEFALPLLWTPATGDVTDTDGRALPLEFHRGTSRLSAAYAETSVKGYYSVEVNGGRAEQLRQDAAAFAVNLSPEESNFETLNETQIRELLPGVELVAFDASAEAQQLHGSIGDEREIWRPLIWFMFLIIAVEFLLSTLKGQKPHGEEGPSVADRVRDVASGAWVGRMTGADDEEEAFENRPLMDATKKL